MNYMDYVDDAAMFIFTGGQVVRMQATLVNERSTIGTTRPVLTSPRVPDRAQISVVSRSTDKLDIFVTDQNGVVFTAAWEPAFTDWWHGWWQLNGGRAAPGAPVHGVSRSTDKLDVFVIGNDNRVYTAAWEPAFTDWWHGWWQLNGGVAAPGAHVTVVSRNTDKLDVFVVGTDGRVYTAGSIVRKEERAEDIAKTAEHALQKLAPITSKPVRERISVYYARGSDGFRAVRSGSSLDEGIELAGGRNVVSAGEGIFSVVNGGDVAALAPSVVVLADPKAAEPDAPLRTALPAGTRFLVDPGFPYGWIERPLSLNRLIGALWLASNLYPGEISFPKDAHAMSVALFYRAPTEKSFVDANPPATAVAFWSQQKQKTGVF